MLGWILIRSDQCDSLAKSVSLFFVESPGVFPSPFYSILNSETYTANQIVEDCRPCLRNMNVKKTNLQTILKTNSAVFFVHQLFAVSNLYRMYVSDLANSFFSAANECPAFSTIGEYSVIEPNWHVIVFVRYLTHWESRKQKVLKASTTS